MATPQVYVQSVSGLRDCEPAVLAQLMWTLQNAPVTPDHIWLEAYVGAAAHHLARFSRTQLEGIISGLYAINSGRVEPLPFVPSFTLMAREWMV